MNKVSSQHIFNSLPVDNLQGTAQEEMRNLEAINMNAGYLLSVLALMEEFRMLKLRGYNGSRKCPDYYDNLHNILFTMRDLLDPKMTEDEKIFYDKELVEIRNDIRNIFQQTDKGIFAKPELMDRSLMRLSVLFRNSLRTMNKIGMLTKQEASPLKAMSEMSE